MSRHIPPGLRVSKQAMHLASSQPWPLLHAAMLQSSALTVPASTGTPSERQCLLSAADAEWEAWPRTQRKEEWPLEPGSQPSILSVCDSVWTATTKAYYFFSQVELCHRRYVTAFLPCWKRKFCQGASLTPSLPCEAGKESSSQSLSWYFMAGAFKAILGQPFFPGRPSRPTLREGVPITGLPAVQLVVTDWPVLWTRQQATKYFPVGYIHSTCLGLQLLLYQLLFLPPRICICVFSVLS